jgi:ubiquitin conjugation factor E4 B
MQCPTHIYEKLSFLGPFFRLSTFPEDSYHHSPSVGEHYFSNPTKRTMNDVMGSTTTLRSVLGGLQSFLHDFSLTLLKSGPDIKEAFLEELAHLLAINAKRAQIRVDKATVSSDGFMNNVCAILLRLAQPFVMSGHQKVNSLCPKGGDETIRHFFSQIGDFFFLAEAY